MLRQSVEAVDDIPRSLKAVRVFLEAKNMPGWYLDPMFIT